MGLLESMIGPVRGKVEKVIEGIIENEESHTDNYIALYILAEDQNNRDALVRVRGYLLESADRYAKVLGQIDQLKPLLGDKYIDRVKERIEDQRAKVQEVLEH